jgi:hypothetical protein
VFFVLDPVALPQAPALPAPLAKPITPLPSPPTAALAEAAKTTPDAFPVTNSASQAPAPSAIAVEAASSSSVSVAATPASDGFVEKPDPGAFKGVTPAPTTTGTTATPVHVPAKPLPPEVLQSIVSKAMQQQGQLVAAAISQGKSQEDALKAAQVQINASVQAAVFQYIHMQRLMDAQNMKPVQMAPAAGASATVAVATVASAASAGAPATVVPVSTAASSAAPVPIILDAQKVAMQRRVYCLMQAACPLEIVQCDIGSRTGWGSAITLSDGSCVNVMGSRITAGTGSGVLVQGGSTLAMTHSQILDCGGSGVTVYSGSAAISSSKISGCAGVAVRLKQGESQVPDLLALLNPDAVAASNAEEDDQEILHEDMDDESGAKHASLTEGHASSKAAASTETPLFGVPKDLVLAANETAVFVHPEKALIAAARAVAGASATPAVGSRKPADGTLSVVPPSLSAVNNDLRGNKGGSWDIPPYLWSFAVHSRANNMDGGSVALPPRVVDVEDFGAAGSQSKRRRFVEAVHVVDASAWTGPAGAAVPAADDAQNKAVSAAPESAIAVDASAAVAAATKQLPPLKSADLVPSKLLALQERRHHQTFHELEQAATGGIAGALAAGDPTAASVAARRKVFLHVAKGDRSVYLVTQAKKKFTIPHRASSSKAESDDEAKAKDVVRFEPISENTVPPEPSELTVPEVLADIHDEIPDLQGKKHTFLVIDCNRLGGIQAITASRDPRSYANALAMAQKARGKGVSAQGVGASPDGKVAGVKRRTVDGSDENPYAKVYIHSRGSPGSAGPSAASAGSSGSGAAVHGPSQFSSATTASGTGITVRSLEAMKPRGPTDAVAKPEAGKSAAMIPQAVPQSAGSQLQPVQVQMRLLQPQQQSQQFVPKPAHPQQGTAVAAPVIVSAGASAMPRGPPMQQQQQQHALQGYTPLQLQQMQQMQQMRSSYFGGGVTMQQLAMMTPQQQQQFQQLQQLQMQQMQQMQLANQQRLLAHPGARPPTGPSAPPAPPSGQGQHPSGA